MIIEAYISCVFFQAQMRPTDLLLFRVLNNYTSCGVYALYFVSNANASDAFVFI